MLFIVFRLPSCVNVIICASPWEDLLLFCRSPVAQGAADGTMLSRHCREQSTHRQAVDSYNQRHYDTSINLNRTRWM